MISWKNIVFQLVGGLGVFLYGMYLMSEGLQHVAGDRMRKFLAYLTKNRFLGVALGTVVTSVIQSSSATTVMTVGLVNAGIMNLTQAISVIMGANIGTTITAQIIAFNIMEWAPILIGVGVGMAVFMNNKRWNLTGQAILGLGFLFFGIILMSKGVEPLKNHESIRLFFQHFSKEPLKGLLAGLIMTCVLQSSSATIGLAIVLAQQGLIDFNGAVALVIGDNIGTTITAQIAALNTSRPARRAAMSHTMFNVLGACIFMPFVFTGLYQKFIIKITPGNPADPAHIARFIANSHSAFNIINTIIFIGLIKVLEKVSIWFVPILPEETKKRPTFLEPHLLDNAPIALDMVRKELVLMLDVAEEASQKGMDAITNKDRRSAEIVHKLEDETDVYQKAITEYLISLAEHDLTTDESEQIPTLLHSANDVERVGDNAENLGEIASELQTRNLAFSPDAVKSLKEMGGLILDMFPPLKKSVDGTNLEGALDVLTIEKKVNAMRHKLDEEHLERLKSGACHLPSATFYVDAVHYLEKIGDHLKNIAQTSHNMFTYSKGKAKIAKGPSATSASPQLTISKKGHKQEEV